MHLGRNLLFYGDSLDVLRNRIPSASVDLIYPDPQCNSNRSYNVLFRHRSGAEAQAQIEAFDDTWTYSLFEGTSEIQRLVIISRANRGMA